MDRAAERFFTLGRGTVSIGLGDCKIMKTLGNFLCSLSASAFLLVAAVGVAGAQQSTYYGSGNSGVIVDLSVLDDGGYGPVGLAPSVPWGGQGLLMPGERIPISELHVPSPTGSTYPEPRAVATETRAAVQPPPASEAPATKPEEPRIAAIPQSAPALPAAPPAAPRKPEPVAAEPVAGKPPAAEPEAPKEPEEKVEATATAAAAPPPPPPPPPTPGPTATPRPAEALAEAPATPKPEETAALTPPDGSLAPGVAVTVEFPATVSKLPPGAEGELESLVAQLMEQVDLRLQLMAYAGGESLSSSKARRLSLSRALSVRSHLIQKGIRSTRIDVRALGNKTADEPVNRVDVVVIGR